MVDIAALNNFSHSVIILLSVVVLKKLTSLLLPLKPLAFFQFYCNQLANKVNKRENSHSQQRVAGIAGILITLFPLYTIIWLFEAFIEVNWLWQALLLYFSFGSFQIGRYTRKIGKYLHNNQKYEAKQQLKLLVLRETEQLSPMGISKASIEMSLLRLSQEYFTVAILFLAFGPLIAFMYRLLLEMHYSWNIKKSGFYHFGISSNQLVQLVQWFPARILTALILLSSLGQNMMLNFRLTSRYFFKLNNDAPIAALAFAIGAKLGGVAIYNGIKLRKRSFNDQGRQPEVLDINKASSRLSYATLMATFVLIAITVLQQLLFSNISY